MPKRSKKSPSYVNKKTRQRRRMVLENNDISTHVTDNKEHQDSFSENHNDNTSSNFTKIVLGTINQSDVSVTNSGLQCTCIALNSFSFCSIKNPRQWTCNDIDDIVVSGDALFTECTPTGSEPRILGISDLPPYFFDLQNNMYELTVNVNYSIYGYVAEQPDNIFAFATLLDAISTSFAVSDFVFLICREYTVSLIKSEKLFFLFDSHSRDCSGCCSSEHGSAVLMHFNNIVQVQRHLVVLFQTLNVPSNELFEITPVRVVAYHNILETSPETLTITRNKRNSARYRSDNGYATHKKKTTQLLYESNKDYREKKRIYSQKKYAKNPSFAYQAKLYHRKKYAENQSYSNKKKQNSRKKYSENLSFAQSVNDYGKRKYKTNECYRNNMIRFGKWKYAIDVNYAFRMNRYSVYKYARNHMFAKSLREYNKKKYKKKYHSDQQYAEIMKQRNKRKYTENIPCSETVKMRTKKRRLCIEKHDCIASFHLSCNESPSFICTVCHRLLFKEGVRHYLPSMINTKHVLNTVKCVSSKYTVHSCV
jgi:Herpesvirus tegument protein, N-terminal conserved region